MALALSGLRVWDGVADDTVEELQTVRIEGDRITGIGSAASLRRNARVVDLEGATALPGLIDAHVHLGLDPELKSPDEQAAVAPNERIAAMARRAGEMIAAGITTARDLGGGDWSEIALRDRIIAGELRGPRLLCAGQPLTSPGGHCHFWGGEAESRDDIAAVIARQVEHDADWIKVMETGGVFTPGSSARDTQFDKETLSWLVEVARKTGRHVAAHCHGSEGIAFAVAAGVRTIEHCSFAGSGGFGSAFDPALVSRMAAGDLWVSPTVNAGWGRRIEHKGAPTDFFRRMSHALRQLTEAGVRLIASTDAGIPGVAHHRLPEALAVLAEYTAGSPAFVLRTATSGAAEALGLAKETGVIRPGLAADILVVDGDPLEDLAALCRPVGVSARGDWVAGR
jgi:imidazolonepropionase-like amidohydrolase